jgi:hypothetical protein
MFPKLFFFVEKEGIDNVQCWDVAGHVSFIEIHMQ